MDEIILEDYVKGCTYGSIIFDIVCMYNVQECKCVTRINILFIHTAHSIQTHIAIWLKRRVPVWQFA